MRKSRKLVQHNKVDYYKTKDSKVDVFLHKNEKIEETEGEDGEKYKEYVAEEVYFKVDSSITKKEIKNNFEFYWQNRGLPEIQEVSIEDRLEMAEDTINFLLGL